MSDCLGFSNLIPAGLSQREIASKMKVTQQCVSSWVSKNEVQAKRVAEFSKITGIPKHKLNPVFAVNDDDESEAA